MNSFVHACGHDIVCACTCILCMYNRYMYTFTMHECIVLHLYSMYTNSMSIRSCVAEFEFCGFCVWRYSVDIICN